MLGRKCAAACLLLVSLGAAGFRVQAQPASPQADEPAIFRTENPNLNAKIARGEVTVSDYVEPTAERKQAIDATLRELGYTEEKIRKTPWPLKERRAELRIPGDGAHPHPTGSAPGPDPAPTTPGGHEAETQTLDPRQMELSYSVGPVGDDQYNRNRFVMYADWDWDDMPFWTLTDKIGWTWAADHNFHYQDDSMHNRGYFYGCHLITCKWKSLNYGSRTVDGEVARGVGVEIDLIHRWYEGIVEYTVMDMHGTADLLTYRYRNHNGGNYTFGTSARYFHKNTGCSGTLNWERPLKIGISCSDSYNMSDTLLRSRPYTD